MLARGGEKINEREEVRVENWKKWRKDDEDRKADEGEHAGSSAGFKCNLNF